MNNWAKDPLLTNSLYLTISIMGIIATFALINVVYGFYTKFPSSLEEFLISPVTNWNITQGALFASAVAILSSINFLKRKLGPWTERVDRKLWELERGLKPDVYYSCSYEEKMKKKETEKSAKNFHYGSLALLVIGLIIGGSGWWLYLDFQISVIWSADRYLSSIIFNLYYGNAPKLRCYVIRYCRSPHLCLLIS